MDNMDNLDLSKSQSSISRGNDSDNALEIVQKQLEKSLNPL